MSKSNLRVLSLIPSKMNLAIDYLQQLKIPYETVDDLKYPGGTVQYLLFNSNYPVAIAIMDYINITYHRDQERYRLNQIQD